MYFTLFFIKFQEQKLVLFCSLLIGAIIMGNKVQADNSLLAEVEDREFLASAMVEGNNCCRIETHKALLDAV